MEFYKERAKHHDKVFDYFDFDHLDAFHNQNVLSVIYGHNWDSVLITEGQKAFLHTFAKHQIGSSEWYDIEPFIGYAGPVTNTEDSGFIRRALDAYSALCKNERIIAEIMRFNCILLNHERFDFAGISPLTVFPAKEIVVVDCMQDEVLQLRQFDQKSCRYMIKRWGPRYIFRLLNKDDDWNFFLELYNTALKKVDADNKWYFSDSFFQRVKHSERFVIFSVWHETDLVSAAVVIEHPLAGYYFLAANSDDMMPGAGELLIHNIALNLAAKDISLLILGGGNTPSVDDPLLRFKKKFTKSPHTFFMGKIIHNPEIFNEFILDAIKMKPELKDTNFFLKYRLVM